MPTNNSLSSDSAELTTGLSSAHRSALLLVVMSTLVLRRLDGPGSPQLRRKCAGGWVHPYNGLRPEREATVGASAVCLVVFQVLKCSLVA